MSDEQPEVTRPDLHPKIKAQIGFGAILGVLVIVAGSGCPPS